MGKGKDLFASIKNFDLDPNYLFQEDDVIKDLKLFEENFGTYEENDLEELYNEYSGNLIGGFLVKTGEIKSIQVTETGYQTGVGDILIANNLANMFAAYIIAKYNLPKSHLSKG